ncbi:hypothetical protein FRC02_005060, partial [Tulasnella sp. 418]
MSHGQFDFNSNGPTALQFPSVHSAKNNSSVGNQSLEGIINCAITSSTCPIIPIPLTDSLTCLTSSTTQQVHSQNNTSPSVSPQKLSFNINALNRLHHNKVETSP